MDKEAVEQRISRDRAEWGRLTAILDAHPDEILHDPQSPPWVSRDVYAHLARWLNYSNKDMEAHRDGRATSPPMDNIEEINTKWQKEDSHLILTEARKRAYEAFERRLTIITSIPIGLWDKELERISRYDGFEHYALHRKYVFLT